MKKKKRKKLSHLYFERDRIDREIDNLLKISPLCVDCGVNVFDINESYMVHHHVWKKAGMKPLGGKLCVGCIEKRLGRKLNCNDFFMIGLNINAYIYPWCGSKRLRKRIHDYKSGAY